MRQNCNNSRRYSAVSKPFIIVTQLLSSFALSIESLIWSFMS